MTLLFNTFYSADGPSSGARELGGMGEVTSAEIGDDQLALLDDDVEEPKVKAKPDLTIDEPDEKPDVTSEEPEEKVEGQDEDEEVEEDEEKPEEIPETRLSFKEINAKYPQLFKDFPELRTVMAKEYQFSQVFPTVSDAKEALAKAETFDFVDQSLARGEAKPFIDHFRKNPEAFNGFMGNFVKEIRANHNEAYTKMVFPAIKQILKSTLGEGKGKNDLNLQKAALIVARNLWGSEYQNILGQKDEPAKPEKSERELELEQQLEESHKNEQQRFHRGVYEAGMSALNTVLQNGFLRTLKMPEFKGKTLTLGQKEYITKKSLETLGVQLNKNGAHVANMKSLFSKAAKAGFAGEWTARVSTAYLAGAKNLLPAIQQRLIAQELNGVEEKKTTKQPIGEVKKGTKGNSNSLVEKLRKGEISEEDFLAS